VHASVDFFSSVPADFAFVSSSSLFPLLLLLLWIVIHGALAVAVAAAAALGYERMAVNCLLFGFVGRLR
jgi:hypothetical protein